MARITASFKIRSLKITKRKQLRLSGKDGRPNKALGLTNDELEKFWSEKQLDDHSIKKLFLHVVKSEINCTSDGVLDHKTSLTCSRALDQSGYSVPVRILPSRIRGK